RPGRMLRVEEAQQLVVRDLDAELAEHAAHLRGVFDLLDDAGLEPRRDVRVAEALREPRDWLPPDRREPGAMAVGQQLRVGIPAHERVAPVEENCAQHGRLRYPRL